jgi:curved DNA-binding protein
LLARAQVGQNAAEKNAQIERWKEETRKSLDGGDWAKALTAAKKWRQLAGSDPEADMAVRQAEERLANIKPETSEKSEEAGSQASDFDWSQWQAQPGGGRTASRTVNPEEFEKLFGAKGGFSDIFEGLFGDPSSQKMTRKDSQQTVQITLAEAFHGTTRSLKFTDGRLIQVKIPPGVKTGSRVRLRGLGKPGGKEGQPGDLFIIVEVSPDELFQRQGDDLKVEVFIPRKKSLFGRSIEVPTLGKPVTLKLPKGDIDGKVFRLRGLGMPNLRSPDERGDLYVTVKYEEG